MAKRKIKVTKEIILEAYMDYVLNHGKQPASVYRFAKENSFDESKFYEFYGDFSAIEMNSFSQLFDATMKTIESSTGFKKLNAREKLLTFYYTFFENLTANRSYIKFLLTKDNSPIKNLSVLKQFRPHFLQFVGTLNIETMDMKSDTLHDAQQKTIQESAWVQFLLTLKFWVDDSSAGFQKTDIFIEKAVNTSFDLMDVKPIKSLVDFGKFVLQERTMFSSKMKRN